jgi:hypothetical protein
VIEMVMSNENNIILPQPRIVSGEREKRIWSERARSWNRRQSSLLPVEGIYQQADVSASEERGRVAKEFELEFDNEPSSTSAQPQAAVPMTIRQWLIPAPGVKIIGQIRPQNELKVG